MWKYSRTLCLGAMMLNGADIARAQQPRDVSGVLLNRLFGVPDTLHGLRMSLADVKRLFPRVRPEMASFEHQLWSVPSAPDFDVTFLVQADATSDSPPRDSVASIEISLATSNAKRFRQHFALILAALEGAREPWRCTRDTVLPQLHAIQWVNFHALWQSDKVGIDLSSVVSHGTKRGIAASGIPAFRVRVRFFRPDDVLAAPNAPARSDTPCVFRRSNLVTDPLTR